MGVVYVDQEVMCKVKKYKLMARGVVRESHRGPQGRSVTGGGGLVRVPNLCRIVVKNHPRYFLTGSR